MKIIYASSGANLDEIKSLGFDVVLGDFSVSDMDRMVELGLSNMPHSFIEHDAVIAYYLYDEPDVNKISIEDQEKKIAEYRAKTDKPLAIALIEEVEQLCSSNYDWYMMDIYYSNKMSKFKNYLNIALSSHFIQVLYKGKKILPIMGLYDDKDPFVYTDEIFPFDKKFRSYFRTEDQAVFIWAGDGVNYNGVTNREIYKEWALELNTSTDKCWWITSKVLYFIAWGFLKINPKLGKYKISIP
jgi:hypothetical protein